MWWIKEFFIFLNEVPLLGELLSPTPPFVSAKPRAQNSTQTNYKQNILLQVLRGGTVAVQRTANRRIKHGPMSKLKFFGAVYVAWLS